VRCSDNHFPLVLEPQWSFAGKRQGGRLRQHRSKKLCVQLPERRRFSVVAVFGAADRAAAEGSRDARA
jgi:hypothetical protein